MLVLDGRVAGQDQTRFYTGVELDQRHSDGDRRSGRFVDGLSQRTSTSTKTASRAITQFGAERVPVSLGILLDTSGSMRGEKIDAARAALGRFLYDLLGRDDEFFLYRSTNAPELVAGLDGIARW